MEYQEEQKRIRCSRKKYSQTRRRRIRALLAVLAAIVLLCLGGLIWGRHGPQTPYDPNAVDTPQKPLSEEDMLRELQKAADESAFRFKINSEVTVVQGGQVGDGEKNSPIPSSETETGWSLASQQTADWNIINSIENNCNMEVSVTGKDGTLLFESRTLRPGEQELTGTLLTELAPGSHEAEATAKAIDPETGEVVGTVTAEIILQVQE